MPPLKEGSKAPLFKGIDQDGKSISSSDFRGKKFVLYFYPEDMTETCTVQACNLRDNFSLLKKKGISIVGISPDPVKKHKKFEEKFDLPFRLIADENHTIINNYGVWGDKVLFGRKYKGLLRTTFLVDEKGVIKKIFWKPKSKMHSEEIMEAWQLAAG
ncbi:MAG TPA: thioredoxin-dependent thiol peroxidase [Ferruginibacter sp.]|nr:thioredoxin-dependent thiol peroxidase [Ferruginibacter sp.]